MTPTVDAQRISERLGFYLDVASSLFASGVFDEERITLRKGRLSICADAYFILNTAYKAWRMNDGHNTELPKVAAISSLVVMAVEPFRPTFQEDARNRIEAQSNEIFALALASATMGVPIDTELLTKNSYLRILDFISCVRSTTITPLIEAIDTNSINALQSVKVAITAEDKHHLNALITINELILARGE